ncbi:hypothetical protein [Alkalicoccus chagannorensis]|uniref:hypothetical protein n=1 Tax=Alkalicoccus chagannorensis TaxID=427072 RepID=UPI0004256E9C|nr:hypothetical protein [Alkalicoccus chagannorensis]
MMNRNDREALALAIADPAIDTAAAEDVLERAAVDMPLPAGATFEAKTVQDQAEYLPMVVYGTKVGRLTVEVSYCYDPAMPAMLYIVTDEGREVDVEYKEEGRQLVEMMLRQEAAYCFA